MVPPDDYIAIGVGQQYIVKPNLASEHKDDAIIGRFTLARMPFCVGDIIHLNLPFVT